MGTIARLILIISFLTILGGMGVLSLISPPSELHWHEMRQPNPFPTLALKNLKAFPQQFDNYFNDRTAFRWQSILARNWAKYSLFGTSGTNTVVVGRDGLLYLDDDVRQGLAGALAPFSDDEVNAIADYYEANFKWMQSRGIYYQMVIVPGKAAACTNQLPSCLGRGWRRKRLAQVLDVLKARHVPVLDLTERLTRGAQNDRNGALYFKFDTHWNDRGALIGARAIEETLQCKFPRVNRLAMATSSESVHRLIYADLARMLGVHDAVRETFQKISLDLPMPEMNLQTPLSVVPASRPVAAKTSESHAEDVIATRYTTGLNHLPSAVIFCDSFATGLAPFLSHDFKTSAWYRQPEPSRQVIEREHPDVVIHEMADRFVALRLPASVAETLAQKPSRKLAEK